MKIIISWDKDYDTSDVDKTKIKDLNFYINAEGKVVVCFGPYSLGYGGWSKFVELDSCL